MGLTRKEAESLGLGHLFPTESKPLPSAPPPPSQLPDDGMNKWERLFHGLASCHYGPDGVYREPFKLRLAGRTYYTIDFFTPSDLHCWEIKGHMRDDAAVKIKVAAELHPYYNFVLVTRDAAGNWRCRYVTRTGISRDVWRPGWL